MEISQWKQVQPFTGVASNGKQSRPKKKITIIQETYFGAPRIQKSSAPPVDTPLPNHTNIQPQPTGDSQRRAQRLVAENIEFKFKQLEVSFELEAFSDAKVKKVSIVEQYGQDDQRLVKMAIKRYLSQLKILSILNLCLVIHEIYPCVSVQFSTDKSEQQLVSLLDLTTGIKRQSQTEGQFKAFAQKIYYANYSKITPGELLKYKAILDLKVESLRMPKTFRQIKGTTIDSILACYNMYRDQLNFVAVTNNWDQVHFNHLLFQANKEKLKSQYSAYKSLTKLHKDQHQQKNVQEGLIDNHELSSDQENIVIVPPNAKETRSKLQLLFSESLDSFEDEIKDKEDRQEALEVNTDQNNQDKIQKIMEEISELDTALQNYKDKRQQFANEFKTFQAYSPLQEPMYKELKMLRNQLGSKLPIISRKQDLFKALQRNNLIVLEGETGSGKSTQLPQILCEFYNVFRNKNSKGIICTQPRKLSTRSLAQRVAFQLDQKMHGFVDYVSSSGKDPQKHSKIVFILDRLLLDQLEKDPLLSKYHCLVLDQAHQRTLSIDISIGLIKNLLKKRPDFKVIITSATLDAGLFQKYFGVKTFKVSGRLFPVEVIYKPMTNVSTNQEKIRRILDDEILKGANREKYNGHILVFCTSVGEITTLCRDYSEKAHIKVLPLHGNLTPQEQRLIFQPENKSRKLIFSTRIAETAVTIDKVKVVVDLGIDRQMAYDQKKKISSFQLMPISKSTAIQRSGRAGRTSSGYCFRLYSQQSEHKNMIENKIPQIESVPLDILILRLKQLKIKDVISFPFISKPNEDALKESQDRMQIMGCLDQELNITEIGQTLVKIPIQPFISRALIEGIIIDTCKPQRRIFQRLLKTLAMIVNAKDLFFSKRDDVIQREELDQIKFEKFSDKEGDFISLLNVFETFQQELSRKNVYKWCRDNFLNKKALYQALQLYKEVNQIIQNIKIDRNKCREFFEQVLEKQKKFKSTKDLLLSCILPSFCQQLCLYSGNSKVGYTSIKRAIPLQIYGSSFLSLQGITPKWIVSYDVFTTSATFCRLAQAVQFALLKKSLPDQLYKRYKIQECESVNPFYQKSIVSLPTVVYNEFKRLKFSNVKLHYLNSSTVLFQDDLGRVQVYSNKNQIVQVKKYIDQSVLQMTREISQKYSRYPHVYLGSITAVVGQGCKVDSLNFSNYLYSIKIYKANQNAQYAIQQMDTQNVVKTESTYNSLFMYFNEQRYRTTYLAWLHYFIQSNPDYFKQKMDIVVEKGFEQRKDKATFLKVKVVFFIGEQRKNNLLLTGYQNQDQAQLMIDSYLYKNVRCIKHARVSKGGKSITVYLREPSTGMDEIDFQEQLQRSMRDNDAYGWKSPKQIVGFRNTDTKLSRYTPNQWKDQLMALNLGAAKDDIFIKGFGDRGSEYWTTVVANIKMYDAAKAQAFKTRYDKKKNVLGNQKVHVKISHSQSLAKVPKIIFDIFSKAYFSIKYRIQSENPRVSLEERTTYNQTGGCFVLIESFSSVKEDLIQPASAVRDIFTALQVPLDELQLKVLNKRYNSKVKKVWYYADKFFEQIEFQLDYEVKFQMSRNFSYLKVYAKSEKAPKALKSLKLKIQECKNLMVKISYKGKNIHQVLKILKQYSKDIQYQILFAERVVEVIGSILYVNQIQNSIYAIVNKGKAECGICDSVLLCPFTLFNCKHTFCKYCLTSSIRSIAHNPGQYPLKCPSYASCKRLISILDLKTCFQQQEFDRMCDKGVTKLVDGKKYHGCLTSACEMIFEVKESQKQGSFKCSQCTMHYCYQCKGVFHQGYTCQEFKDQDLKKKPAYREVFVKTTRGKPRTQNRR